MVQATTQDKGGKNFAQQTAENIKNSWDKYKHYDAAAQKAQVEWWQDKWNATVDLTAKVTTGIVKNVSRATAEFHNGTQYFTKVAQESYAAARKQEGAYADGPESVNANNDKTYAASVNTDKSTMGSRNTQQAIAKPASASSASWSDKYVKGALQATGASLVGAGVGAGVASALTGASFGALALAATPALGVVAGGLLLGAGVVKVAEMTANLFKGMFGGRNGGGAAVSNTRSGSRTGQDFGQPEAANNAVRSPVTDTARQEAAKALAEKILKDLNNKNADGSPGDISESVLQKLGNLSPTNKQAVMDRLGKDTRKEVIGQAMASFGFDKPMAMDELKQIDQGLTLRDDEALIRQQYEMSRS